MKYLYISNLIIRKTTIFLTIAFALFIISSVDAQNVGITDSTTVTPNFLLHLHKKASSGATSFSQFTNTLEAVGTGATEGFTFDFDGSFNLNINNREATFLGFNTSGSPRMIILSDGKVGIGTTSPTTLLSLRGSTPYICTSTTDGSDNNLLSEFIEIEGLFNVNFSKTLVKQLLLSGTAVLRLQRISKAGYPDFVLQEPEKQACFLYQEH